MLFTWLKRYADFAGRSSRKEYWLGFVGYLLVVLAAAIIDGVAFNSTPIVYLVVLLASLVPLFALGVRRLHDLDLTGWLILLGLIPLVGLLLLYWAVQPGQPRSNRFGAPPPETPGLAIETESEAVTAPAPVVTP